MARRLKNVTVTLEEEVARWARIEAARRGTSVSRLLGEVLRSEMLRDAEYEAAKILYMGQKPRTHRRSGQSMPTREELHERVRLR